MAWVAVNKDGTEYIFNIKPFRGDTYSKICEKYNIDYPNKNEFKDNWYDKFTDGYYQVPKSNGVLLSQGSIKKLTNQSLTWDDEPVKV